MAKDQRQASQGLPKVQGAQGGTSDQSTPPFNSRVAAGTAICTPASGRPAPQGERGRRRQSRELGRASSAGWTASKETASSAPAGEGKAKGDGKCKIAAA